MTRSHAAARRTRAFISVYTTNHLHLRNPWVVAFFAFSYPGFGNMLLQRYVKALILILWELFINHHAKINLGIMYSLQGRFDEARAAVDERWLILYVGIYMYAIWDSYRSTVDMNKLYMLAEHEDAAIPNMKMGDLGINFLDKRIPWLAIAWSVIMPGLGQLYVNKLLLGFFIFLYTLAICCYANLPQAIHLSMAGDFSAAKKLVDMQWFLYLPSIYMFIIYDAYVCAVEQNKLFEKEQTRYLRANYQHPDFAWPVKEDAQMVVVATFEQSVNIELAISALEEKGVSKACIAAVPLVQKQKQHTLFDSIHRADGISTFDSAAIIGTCFMLLGAIYGYLLKWGPIIWGMIGAVSGCLIGFVLKLFLLRHRMTGKRALKSEAVLMVACEANQRMTIEGILWEHAALGISYVDKNPAEVEKHEQ